MPKPDKSAPTRSVGLPALLTADAFLKALRAHIYTTYRNQRGAAKAWGMSDAMVSAIVTGRKAPTPRVLDEMGFEKVTAYKLVGS